MPRGPLKRGCNHGIEIGEVQTLTKILFKVHFPQLNDIYTRKFAHLGQLLIIILPEEQWLTLIILIWIFITSFIYCGHVGQSNQAV